MSDISNMQLLDEPIDYNPTAEFESKKIPDGTYLATLSVGKWGVQPVQSGGKTIVKAQVVATIHAPGERFDGFRVNSFIDSRAFSEGGPSLLQQMLFRGGVTSGASTARELMETTEQFLTGQPQLLVKLRLEAGKKVDNKWQSVKGSRNFSDQGYAVIGGEEVEGRETIYGFATPNSSAGA